VTNMASASLESALPTSLSTSALLAPEEVYAPAASDARAKGELTPTEKRAARTKERKKRKKQRDSLTSAAEKSLANGVVNGRGTPRNVKEAKDQALKGLVKSGKGVTVVGKNSPKAAGKGKGIEETSAKNQDVAPERDGKKFKL
jgi:U3 small nucleolar RNA-associated protein MPP10